MTVKQAVYNKGLSNSMFNCVFKAANSSEEGRYFSDDNSSPTAKQGRAGAYRRFFWKIYAAHMDAAAYAQKFIIQLFRLKRLYKRLQRDRHFCQKAISEFRC